MRHVERIRNLIFQLVLRQDEAEELTQEVFVKVLRNLNGFRGESAVATWLHRIAVNVVREAQRRERRWPSHHPFRFNTRKTIFKILG